MVSPSVSGGSGFTFEDYVVGLYLAYLLRPQAVRGLPSGMISQSVAAQQAMHGWPLDDLLVGASNQYAAVGRLSLQLKESLTISAAKSNSDFTRIVRDSWDTLCKSDFAAGYDRIGAGVSNIPSESLKSIRNITEWAELANDPEYFFRQVDLEDYSNQPKRKFVAAVRSILKQHIGSDPTNEALVRFFKHFTVIRFEFGAPGTADDHAAIEWCRTALDFSESMRAPDLWNELTRIANKLRISGGRIDREALLSMLRHRFKILGDSPADELPPADSVAFTPNPKITAETRHSSVAHAQSGQVVERLEPAPSPAEAGVLRSALEQQILQRLTDLDGDIRQNGYESARATLESIRGDSVLWQALGADIRARVLRALGFEALSRSHIDIAVDFCDEADAIAVATEPRLRALITLRQRGPQAALDVLGQASSIEGKLLHAGLLLELHDAKNGIAALQACEDVAATNAEWNRLRSLAAGIEGDREAALRYAADAEKIAPTWAAIVFNCGMVKYQSSRSSALGCEPIAVPDPIPLGLCLQDERSRGLRNEALTHFKNLLDRKKKGKEAADINLWILACLACDQDRVTEAADCFNSILAVDPIDPRVIFWALARAYDFPFRETLRRLRVAIRGPDGTIDHLQALLACHMSAGHSGHARSALNKYASRFPESSDTSILDTWRARLRSKKAIAASSGDIQTDLITVLAIADSKTNSSELEALVQRHLDRPDIVLALCTALARRGYWNSVGTFAQRLAKDIGGPEAIRLAAYTYFNIGHDIELIQLISEQRDAFPNAMLPTDLQRMQARSAGRLRQFKDAIHCAELLVARLNEPNDRLLLAELYVQEGDVARAASTLREIPTSYKWGSRNALAFSNAVVGEDKILAVQLLEAANAAGFGPELVGSAVDLAYRLGLDTLAHSLLSKTLQDTENLKRSGVKQVSMDDIKNIVLKRRDASVQVTNLYRKGEMPVHLILSGLNIDLAQIWASAFSGTKSHPLLVRSGNRPLDFFGGTDPIPPAIIVDLSALLTADRIGILETLRLAFPKLLVASLLPQALRHLSDRALHHQPSHVLVLEQIIRAYDEDRIRVFEQQAIDSPENVGEIVYQLDEETLASQPETVGGQITLGALGAELARRGQLSNSEFATIQGTFDSWSNIGSSISPANLTSLLFSGNTIESVIAANLFNLTTERFAIFIESSYLAHCRATIRAAEDGKVLSDRLKTLLRYVVDGQQSGYVQLLPPSEPQHDEERPSLDAMDEATQSVFEIISSQGPANRWMWVDDRYITGFARNQDGIIVSTFEILQYLRRCGAVPPDRYFKLLRQLREHHFYVLPISEEEVAHWLRQAPIENGIVLETPELATIRAYLNEILLFESELDLDYGRTVRHKVLESQCLIEINALSRDCLTKIWSDNSSSVTEKVARSTWVWEALRVEHFDRLPLMHPNAVARRGLWMMFVVHLLVIGLSIDAKSATGHLPLRQQYFQWLRTQLADLNESADAGVGNEISTALQDALLGHYAEVRKDSPEQKAVFQHILGTFYQDLPENLQNRLSANSAFMDATGLTIQSITLAGNARFREAEFWIAVDKAVIGVPARLWTVDKIEYSVALSNDQTSISFDLDGQQQSIRLVDPGFNLLSPDATRRNHFLSLHRFEVCLPDEQAPSALTSTTIAPSARVKLFRRLQDLTPQGRYAKLREHIASTQQVALDSMRPPSADIYRRDIGLTDDVLINLDDKSTRLITLCGFRDAFDRLAGIPIKLPLPFKMAFSEMDAADQKALLLDLITLQPTPMRLLRALELVGSLTDISSELRDSAQSIYQIIVKTWLAGAKAFIEVLEWSERVWARDEAWNASSVGTRLSCIWSHADRIYASLLQENVDPTWIETHFSQMHLQNMFDRIQWDAGTDADIASPSYMSPLVLLSTGLNLIVKQGSDLLDLFPPQPVLDILIGGSKENLKLQIRLLEDRSKGQNALASYLADEYSTDFADRIRISGNSLLSTDTRQTLRREVLATAQTEPANADSWLGLGALGPQWLDADESFTIAKAVDGLIFPIGDIDQKTEAVLLVVARLLPLLPEGTRHTVELKLLGWAKHLAKTHFNPGVEYQNKEARSPSIHAFAELLVVLARTPVKADSIKRVAELIDKAILEWPASAELWRMTLNIAMRNSSYINLELLWPTFVRLRAIK
ncbi:MAG: hypothetical protein JWR07_5136 [Nevskia sp.]|nr:hypothetical protein [Nevskia sp.]